MENILTSINLSTTTAPVVTEVQGKDWINYGGPDEWANLFPQFLIDLYYNSSTQAAIINATAEMIAGEDLIIEDEEERDLEAVAKLKRFFNSANGNETLNEVIKKISFDFKLQGAFALNIIWSEDRTQIAEIYHIPVEKIRCEKANELGKVEAYYVSSDWADTRTHEPYRVPAFNTHDRTSANQILYTGLYSPNMNAYYTPDYVAANNWALVDQRVAEFHLNNISNGFSGSFLIAFANGVPSSEERIQIEQSLAAKFTGADNSGKFVLTFSDDKTRTPEITAITSSDLDKQYLALQELLVQNILTGHRVTSPMLMGIKNATGLGSNADEINSAANFFVNTVCVPYQAQIIRTLRKIFAVNNMDMPVIFEQLKPITTKFTNQDLAAVLTQDEIRNELGYPSLAKEEVVVDASLMTLSKFTVLEDFLDTLEDIPEDWELINEEVVDGEHQDFDYQTVLNDLANDKTELASTGTARPNAKSSQDGVNASYNDYYKVRYIYDRDDSAGVQTGPTRDFCSIMTSASKIYRKEDIVQMEYLEVNKGWGPRGDNETYSIWLYKGGGNCFHLWKRQVYKTSLRNAKSNISDRQLIESATAISEGFTIDREDSRVDEAPRTWADKGFINR
jgi:hypothetical protein